VAGVREGEKRERGEEECEREKERLVGRGGKNEV
jgi:hypothetical protein